MIAGQTWALAPGVAHLIDGAGVPPGIARPSPVRALLPRAMRTPSTGQPRALQLQVIPVFGLLTHRGGSGFYTSTSTAVLGQHVAAADRDPAIGTIVLDVDSQGGMVGGVYELADQLAAVRQAGRTRVVAVINGMAAAGAYWIASQAHEVIITPSGMVGGIGAVMAHTDRTGMLEKLGVRFDYVHAGRHKAEGYREGPLTPEYRAHLQSLVDAHGKAFAQAVARGRGVPLATVTGPAWGEGRMLVAREALKVGMVDSIATFEQTVARLIGRRPSAAPSVISARHVDEAIRAHSGQGRTKGAP